MEKLFAVAGVSKLDGVVKARFAKDMGRVKVLEKNGHTDVRLIELPKVMDKAAAVAFLMAHASFQDAVAQAALKGEGKVAAVAKVTKVKEVKVAAPKVEKTAEEIEAIKAKNLETLRTVGKSWAEKWAEDRATIGEAMLADAKSIMDAIEGEVPSYRWARIED